MVYLGRSPSRLMVRIPLSPSTITRRTSSSVSATKARRRHFFCRIQVSRVSAPVRVLPNPRPARINHTVQSPSGKRWLGRANSSHSPVTALTWVSVDVFMSAIILTPPFFYKMDPRKNPLAKRVFPKLYKTLKRDLEVPILALRKCGWPRIRRLFPTRRLLPQCHLCLCLEHTRHNPPHMTPLQQRALQTLK